MRPWGRQEWVATQMESDFSLLTFTRRMELVELFRDIFRLGCMFRGNSSDTFYPATLCYPDYRPQLLAFETIDLILSHSEFDLISNIPIVKPGFLLDETTRLKELLDFVVNRCIALEWASVLLIYTGYYYLTRICHSYVDHINHLMVDIINLYTNRQGKEGI